MPKGIWLQWIGAAGLVFGCLVVSRLSATSLELSDVSSGPTPPADLRASLDFSVSGSTLTLTASNLTNMFHGYIISIASRTSAPFQRGARVRVRGSTSRA